MLSVETGSEGSLAASWSGPGGREFDVSTSDSGVPLFGEDIMEYMQRTHDEIDDDGELVTAHPKVGEVLLPPPSVFREQTPTAGVATPGESRNSSREDLLAALRIYRRALL